MKTEYDGTTVGTSEEDRRNALGTNGEEIIKDTNS